MPEFDFTQNTTVDSLDKVPEGFRGVYAEVTEGDDAGKFTVVDGAKGLVDAYAGQTKALNSARGDKKKASDESAQRRQSLKAFESIMEDLDIDEESRTAEGLKAKIDDLVATATNGKELKINLDKIRVEMQRKQDEALAGKDVELSKKDKALSKHLIGDVATREITAAKGSVDLLMPTVKQHCKVVMEDDNYVVRVVDDQGDVRSNGAGGWMGVKDLVAELKASDAYGRAFDSEKQGGAGTAPGTTQRRAAPAGDKKTAKDKIASGLKARQARGG